MNKEIKFKLPKNKITDPENDYFTNKASVGWHKGERQIVMDLIKNKNNVIDVGAHVGITCVHWLMSGFKKIYAFEINPSHFECLIENTKEFSNQIEYFPYGCSNVNKKTIGGYWKKSNSGTFQILDETTLKNFNPNETFEIEVKKIDEHNFDSVSLIKIDVEGWEFEVIEGAVSTIKKHKPILFVEYGHGNHRKTFHKYEDKDFKKLINDLNYQELTDLGHRDTIFIPKN
jgi:FkbM family methyltransferase